MSDLGLQNFFNLIKPDRLRNNHNFDIVRATESDKSRVLNSSFFRRMQQKTQVFPLDSNASVRTRLTHSIEVAQIGRYITQTIFKKLSSIDHDFKKIIIENSDKVIGATNAVETACYLHDIGNPPFGHLGEKAIQEWFSNNDLVQFPTNEIKRFDGNAQGLRIISFLSGHDNRGMNLTCLSLLSTIKYPNKIIESDKGLFESDYTYSYLVACQEIGWLAEKKFPLAYIMEAADDIAYCTSDIEDGIEKGIIDLDDIHAELSTIIPIVFNGNFKSVEEIIELSSREVKESNAHLDYIDGDNLYLNPNDSWIKWNAFLKIKIAIINYCVEKVADNFISNIDLLTNNELIPKENEIHKSLIPNDINVEILKKLRNFAKTYLYSNKEVELLELSGYRMISDFLDRFKNVLLLDLDIFLELCFSYINLPKSIQDVIQYDDSIEKKAKNKPFEKRLINMIPNKYLSKYLLSLNYMCLNDNNFKDNEKKIRFQLFVDYISGMTDDYLLSRHQILEGISL